MGFPSDSDVKEYAWDAGTWVQSLGWEDPLEKRMVTHSSTLAWEIPRTEEAGRLQSMGSQTDTTELCTAQWILSNS